MGYTSRSTGLGDDAADARRAWSTFVRSNHGLVTTWPFVEDDFYGQPAARYPVAAYDALIRSGYVHPMNAAQPSRDKRFMYVLAPEGVLSPNFVALGDYGLGDDYQDWSAHTLAIGGVPTAWPFSTGLYAQYYGQWAMKFTGQKYADAANARLFDASAPTQTTPDNSFVYVLAPDNVQQAGPKTMTLFQRAENTVFSAGDTAATKLGLPSLASIESALKGGLTTVAIIGAVLAFVLLSPRGGARNFD